MHEVLHRTPDWPNITRMLEPTRINYEKFEEWAITVEYGPGFTLASG